MVIREGSPAMRHVSRTHRVDLDLIFKRIRREPNVFIKFVGTKQQLTDILTKGSFTAEAWNASMLLAIVVPISDSIGRYFKLSKCQSSRFCSNSERF